MTKAIQMFVRIWTYCPESGHSSLGALPLLGQLSLNLMRELVQVLVHTLHAEPLGVEKTAVRSNTHTAAAHAAGRAQHQKLFLIRTERILSHKTFLKQHNGSGVWWFLAVVCKRAA